MSHTPALTLYGIRACDMVRKARAWLDAAGVPYAWRDHKTAGVDEAALRGWVERLGWEVVLNRAGTTFRALPEAERRGLDAERAVSVMLAHPSSIKRPVLSGGDLLLVGFKPEVYASTLNLERT